SNSCVLRLLAPLALRMRKGGYCHPQTYLILRSATAQAGASLEGRRGADARPAQGRARGVWKTDGWGGPLGYNLGMSRFPIAWPGVPLALLSAGLFGISMPLAKVLLGEGVSPWLLAGLLYLGSGLGLAVLQPARRVAGGGLAIAGAWFAGGLDNNLTRRLSAADPVQIALIKGLAAGAVNLVVALLAGAQLPSAAAIGGAAVVGFVGYGVSLVLFVLGLRHLGAARTGAYFATAPFIGAVVAIALLGEAVTLQLVFAGLLMAVGLYLHLAESHEHEH